MYRFGSKLVNGAAVRQKVGVVANRRQIQVLVRGLEIMKRSGNSQCDKASYGILKHGGVSRMQSTVAQLRDDINGQQGSVKETSEIDRSYQSQQYSNNQVRQAYGSTDTFPRRHIGPRESEVQKMLEVIGVGSMEELIDKTVPQDIRLKNKLEIKNGGMGEVEMLAVLKKIASKNKVYKSYIGMGYSDVVMPKVIQRNLLENPGWYTQYTPYQPEISQGRLESLLNYQTVVMELTGLPIANASLLDEGTAAGEALGVCLSATKGKKGKKQVFFADENLHAQTLAVLKTRAEGLGAEVVVVDKIGEMDFEAYKNANSDKQVVGCIAGYPDTYGEIQDYSGLGERIHAAGGQFVVCAELMSLVALKAPAEFGADIVVGNSQRFGVPLGYGGPHAAFFACTETHKRRIPGRIIGVSKDSKGRRAFRLALQTREQHIKREKATSNVCTAQALLANIAAMYAVYHGPQGLAEISGRIHRMTVAAATVLGSMVVSKQYFDTLKIKVDGDINELRERALANEINLRYIDEQHVGVTFDETVGFSDLELLLEKVFLIQGAGEKLVVLANELLPTQGGEGARGGVSKIPEQLRRSKAILQQPVFNSYHSETEMLRYLQRLQSMDLSLANAMIPLGSCTMKLNATSEMIPITWPEFCQIHPFAPRDQAVGYAQLIGELEEDLANITGMAGTSLQPNSGAQGEYAGLRVIRAYQESIGQGHRNICLVPKSAHGTNPASAVMANLKVVTVECEQRQDSPNSGYLNLEDLRQKAAKYKDQLSSIMITYPSTYGIFEENIVEAIKIVHEAGGQVYMDGANLNAQIGLCSPGEMGADVCHINNHKSLCVPHGGGGPGVGPICVQSHLVPFLPSHPVVEIPNSKQNGIGPVSAAPYGSAGILPITWAYIKMMGGAGLRRATEVAILNANYMAKRLSSVYDILYTNKNGLCAHEFIIDVGSNKLVKQINASIDSSNGGGGHGIGAVDIAKRLQDYGFHPPTMSWPVPNSLMIEPTESESLYELDRFIESMLSIHQEIKQVAQGEYPADNNVLVNSPHPLADLLSSKKEFSYSVEKAAYPLGISKKAFWPTVSRLDDSYGDMNLVCSCAPLDAYED